VSYNTTVYRVPPWPSVRKEIPEEEVAGAAKSPQQNLRWAPIFGRQGDLLSCRSAAGKGEDGDPPGPAKVIGGLPGLKTYPYE
jgi:hypothetical protein